MELAEQYFKQAKWRSWSEMISKLPLSQDQTVLDLGCGPGVVTKLLSSKVNRVTGIDISADLIKAADKDTNQNEDYLVGDIRNLDELGLEKVDGIWSSFSSAYFIDFLPILKSWIFHLNPGGWIAVVEISDLFTGHQPLPLDTIEALKRFNRYLYDTQKYDVQMGSKLMSYMEKLGVRDIIQHEFDDKELCFNGAATSEIIEAWEQRFERLSSMKDVLSEKEHKKVKKDFIKCISSVDHKSNSKVIMCIGKK